LRESENNAVSSEEKRNLGERQDPVLETSLATGNTLQANGYVMFEIPDPLHPAIVHFPIVLIFLGTLVSVLTIFTRRGALPQFAAVILILAAGGAQLAVNTGEDQADEVIQRMPDSKPLIRVHAEWGERVRNAAVFAAISAVVALAAYRLVRVRRILAVITTFIAVWASYCVFEAGEYGGSMVYHHGVGLQLAPKGPGTSPDGAPPASPTPAPAAPATPSG
jgi:uncharacterized membrane protein